MLEDMKMNLHYDPETGVVTYKNSRYGTKTPGEEAGWVDGDHMRIVYKEMKYLLHRVCWALYYGEWPKHSIDHIDRNPFNNRIDNLRDVPQKVNNSNKGKYDSIYTGVYRKASGKYVSYISKDRKKYYLGTFHCPVEAAKAYNTKARELYGEKAKQNSV
jgi:hypothetical protein